MLKMLGLNGGILRRSVSISKGFMNCRPGVKRHDPLPAGEENKDRVRLDGVLFPLLSPPGCCARIGVLKIACTSWLVIAVKT